jgi:hypothetical protein
VSVALSVLAHGITAAPMSYRYADWAGARAELAVGSLEAREAVEVPWRLPVGDREAG